MPRRPAEEMAALRARWIEEVCALRDEGWHFEEIAERVPVSAPTLRRWVTEHAPELASTPAPELAHRHRRRQAFWKRILREHPPDHRRVDELMRERAVMRPAQRKQAVGQRS